MSVNRNITISKITHAFAPFLLLLAGACSSGITDAPTEAENPNLAVAGDRGMVTVQATAFTRKTSVGRHYWRIVADTSAVGGKTLQAMPDRGKTFSPTVGPSADYHLTFDAPGTYYLWVHGSGIRGKVRSSNSLHIGLNGQKQYGASNITGGTYKLGWLNETMLGAPAVLEVPRAGTHTLNVWMREDGFRFDSLTLTRNAAYRPTVSAPTETPKPVAPSRQLGRLTWAPPALLNPRTVRITGSSTQSIIKLDSGRDYLIEMPSEPVRRGLIFVGGRNIVLIGGEIAIPWQGANASITSRTALKIKGATGTVHIEGLLMRGQDVSEGIQIDAPDAVVQIENVGIFNIHARDQVNFSDNHPDLIQTYGNVKRLRIDRFTGSTDYQGLFFAANFNGAHGPIDLKRVNIIGNAPARNLLWLQPQPGAGDVTLDEVYLDTSATRKRNIGEAVYPSIWGTEPNRAKLTSNTVSWPSQMRPQVLGHATSGRPPGGNYVSPEVIGTGYDSPGYN